MPAVLPINQAKGHLPEIIREASESLRVYAVGNARRRDAKRAVIMGEEALEVALGTVTFSPQWDEDQEQGLWTVYLPELDVYGQGSTQDEAASDLVDAVAEYVRIYTEDVRFYFKVGRGDQFRNVLRVLFAMNREEDLRDVLGV